MKFFNNFCIGLLVLVCIARAVSLKSESKHKLTSKANAKNKTNKGIYDDFVVASYENDHLASKRQANNFLFNADTKENSEIGEFVVPDVEIADKLIEIPKSPAPLSENSVMRSAFKPVGPRIDSTVDENGRKYSSFLKKAKPSVKAGFYGKTRRI